MRKNGASAQWPTVEMDADSMDFFRIGRTGTIYEVFAEFAPMSSAFRQPGARNSSFIGSQTVGNLGFPPLS